MEHRTEQDVKRAASILGVPFPPTLQQVKKAFKAHAKKSHPDRGGDEAAFKRFSSAKDLLEEWISHPQRFQPQARHSARPQNRRNPQPPPRRRTPSGRGSSHHHWQQSWYDTRDARSRAARGDRHYRRKKRVDPRDYQPPPPEPESEPEPTAVPGEWFLVRSFKPTFSSHWISGERSRAQLQNNHGIWAVALYLGTPIAAVDSHIEVVLANLDGSGEDKMRRRVISRSYNERGQVSVIWFNPIAD